jgi:hypothetical protein
MTIGIDGRIENCSLKKKLGNCPKDTSCTECIQLQSLMSAESLIKRFNERMNDLEKRIKILEEKK